MLDVAVSYDRYKFLGNEFLTWLWFVIDNQVDILRETDDELVSLHIGNRMVLENHRNDGVERVTIKGDQVGLEEGVLALRKGAVVTEVNLIYKAGSHEWRFSVKGESLNISGLKTPETGPVEQEGDREGAILERIFLIERVVILIDSLYGRFLGLRITDNWERSVVPRIRKWVAA